jgi:hypothetical protein
MSGIITDEDGNKTVNKPTHAEETSLPIALKMKIQSLSELKEDHLRLVIDTIPTLPWSLLPDDTGDAVNQRWLE